MHTNDRCRVRIAHLHHRVHACEAVTRALPAWFGIEEDLEELRTCLQNGVGLVAVDGERVTGFFTFTAPFPETREITGMPWLHIGKKPPSSS